MFMYILFVQLNARRLCRRQVKNSLQRIAYPQYLFSKYFRGYCTPRLLRVSVSQMADGSTDSGRELMNEQVVANRWSVMRSELNQLYSKITELEMELSEHSLVIGAIQPLDPSRKCYRMIGGVLVERTIAEVLPAVQRNKEGLQEVIGRLTEALEKKKKEISEFEVKYKIKIRKADDDIQRDGERKEGSTQGVLVGPARGSKQG